MPIEICFPFKKSDKLSREFLFINCGNDSIVMVLISWQLATSLSIEFLRDIESSFSSKKEPDEKG
jgi:hypothetical protein